MVCQTGPNLCWPNGQYWLKRRVCGWDVLGKIWNNSVKLWETWVETRLWDETSEHIYIYVYIDWFVMEYICNRHQSSISSISSIASISSISSKFINIIIINQSVNQWINQSMNQSINESINQWINQSMNQSINEPINQSTNQSTNQSINQSFLAKLWDNYFSMMMMMMMMMMRMMMRMMRMMRMMIYICHLLYDVWFMRFSHVFICFIFYVPHFCIWWRCPGFGSMNLIADGVCICSGW